jgi:hypothetical protein
MDQPVTGLLVKQFTLELAMPENSRSDSIGLK